MKKILLQPKGTSIFNEEGVNQLTANIQNIYSSMQERANKKPKVGDRLHIHGKGISIITEITSQCVTSMLYTTMICSVPRAEVRWNVDNFRFECRPTSFRVRSAR
jgi:hypothetical protein